MDEIKIYQTENGKRLRGRPLTVNVEDFFQRIPRAASTLEKARETSSGFRNRDILGEEGILPSWLRYAKDVVSEAERRGGEISLSKSDTEKLRAAMSVTRSLGARQNVYREKALVNLQSADFIQSIESALKEKLSKISRAALKRIKTRFESFDTVTKAKFFKTRYYQDIRSASERDPDQRYRRQIEWAEDYLRKRGQLKDNESLTWREAIFVIIDARLARGESTGFDPSKFKEEF